MKEYHRKSELIIEGLSITLTTFKDQAYTLVEMNSTETFKDAEGKEQVLVHDSGITSALDSDELDEIILFLQEASNALKRSDYRSDKQL